MNSKQVVAAVSVVALLIVLVYPALSTGSVSVQIGSTKIENADHVYVTVKEVSAHQTGQPPYEGWKLVSNQSLVIDLVSLQNSTTALAKGQLSLGSYDSIRIEVSNVTWVFNKTTTKLQIQSSLLSANLGFSVAAGKEILLTLVVSGHQENIGGTKFFISQLNATTTVTQHS